MSIKINSNESIQGLMAFGITSQALAKITAAKNNGMIFKSSEDFANIGLSEYEINILSSNVSYELPEPNKDVQYLTVTTEPQRLHEYTLYVRYPNKNTGELIQDIYFIDYDGKTQIHYDNQITAGPFTLFVKAPDGTVIETGGHGKKAFEHEFTKTEFNNISFRVHAIKEIQTSTTILGTPSKIKGKLISSNPSLKLENVQIVFSIATTIDENNNPDYYPVCYAQTETNGYFFSSQLNFRSPGDYNKVLKAKAQIAIAGNPEIPIRLQFMDEAEVGQTLGQIPERVILYLEDQIANTETAETDCGCHDCEDLNFHDKKVLDEFSYYSVVRTTEPLIKALEISDVEEVDLEDLVKDVVTDPKVSSPLVGLKASRLFLRNFVDRHGAISAGNVASLVQQIQQEKLKSKLHKKPKAFNGRLSLDGKNSIDWDDKPTIYEAISISHGHLLHFKQEWFADGYSMGDLLYSLPLAPGQKKQIVVFDWDRKDSASNTQQLDYQESLYNNLSRDRDVNEVAKSVIKEKSFGGSLAGAGGKSSGTSGGILSTLISGVSGAASGFGLAGSLAGQTSSRRATASSQQHVNDRTIQSASSVRSQRSTVIQTASQGERFEVSAESVANYNHCHAMTIQYFEVLRHFQVTTRLADVQECLFIPLEFSPFDRKKAMRWRETLAMSLLNPQLESGFAATERIEDEFASATVDYYDSIGYPQKNYAEKELNYVEGELYLEFQLERPVDALDDAGNPKFDPNAWSFFHTFLGLQPMEFYDRYLKNQQKKDENFFKHAGPPIAQEILKSLRFYAVKRNQQQPVKLPIDATLLSTFGNRKKLNVSLRMSGGDHPLVKREDIDFIEIRIEGDSDHVDKILALMRSAVRVIVHSGTMQYTTDLSSDFLFKNANIKNDLTTNDDPVRIYTPLNANELRNPRKEDALACNALLHHLNENLEYYHQAIWMNMDEQRRFMLLDGIIAPGKANGRSVASVVENKLIGIVGNCMVMPVAPGLQLDPTLDQNIDLYQHYYEDPLDPIRLSLPTKGVFAEAVMGKCNSCEKKDETRFWRWDEAPIPDSPTTINAINTPVPQNIQPNLQAKDFAAPIINLQNAPNLPDPQGYGGLVQLLGNPNVFRDLTGLSENQKNALQAFQASMTGAQNFASMSKDLATQHANQVNSQAMVEAIRNAPELTKDEKAQLIKDHFKQMIDGGESKRKEQETTAKNGKPGLSDVAARAEEKGKAVKASSVDPNTGVVETLEVGEMVVDETVFAEATGTIVRLSQANKKACWATVATMMMSWKRKASMPVETVLEEAGDYYLEKYGKGEGLKSSEKDEFISALGMVGEQPASYPMQQFIDWVNTYGLIWVTTDSAVAEDLFSPHARVLFKITGTDVTNEKTTQFHFINPTTGGEVSESFETFLSKFEQMATDNTGNLFKQIVRFSDVFVRDNGTEGGEAEEGGENPESITIKLKWSGRFGGDLNSRVTVKSGSHVLATVDGDGEADIDVEWKSKYTVEIRPTAEAPEDRYLKTTLKLVNTASAANPFISKNFNLNFDRDNDLNAYKTWVEKGINIELAKDQVPFNFLGFDISVNRLVLPRIQDTQRAFDNLPGSDLARIKASLAKMWAFEMRTTSDGTFSDHSVGCAIDVNDWVHTLQNSRYRGRKHRELLEFVQFIVRAEGTMPSYNMGTARNQEQIRASEIFIQYFPTWLYNQMKEYDLLTDAELALPEIPSVRIFLNGRIDEAIKEAKDRGASTIHLNTVKMYMVHSDTFPEPPILAWIEGHVHKSKATNQDVTMKGMIPLDPQFLDVMLANGWSWGGNWGWGWHDFMHFEDTHAADRIIGN